jgi:hypothetical protein
MPVFTPLTGCQVQIQMNLEDGTTTTLTEASYFKYNIQQAKQPVFNYNATTFKYDHIMHGQKMITGAFAINFVHPQYMVAVLISNTNFSDKYKAPSDAASITKVKNNAIDRIKYIKSLRERTKALSSDPTKAKRYLNTTLEDADLLAGTEYGSPVDITTLGGETDILDKLPPITINISFNNISGNIEDLRNPTSRGRSRILKNVALTSLGQEFQPSGEPLQEVYTFIASNVEGYFGQQQA